MLKAWYNIIETMKLNAQGQPPKIAIFSLAHSPFFGGAEVAIKEITHRLRDKFKFTCFTYRFDKSWSAREVKDGIDIVRLGRGGSGAKDYYGNWMGKRSYIFQSFFAAVRVHKQEPFACVWAVMASYAGAAALLFKLWHPAVPMLLTLQEGDSEGHILGRVRFFYPLWRLLFRKADHIQVISNYLADLARRHGATCPITVVPNGVAVGKWQSANGKAQMAKEKFKEFTIITTSRLVHKNGVDTLIRAAGELKKMFAPKFKAVIVGGGPLESALKGLAKKIRVDDVVEFLGNVSPEQVPLYLRSADIFARASRSEGLGNSFLEAMAEGLPVIGTPVGGIPDFLKDPSQVGVADATGIFTKVDDPADLARKILLLVTKADIRKTIAQNGRALVIKNYSWDGIAESMGAIFEKLCAY